MSASPRPIASMLGGGAGRRSGKTASAQLGPQRAPKSALGKSVSSAVHSEKTFRSSITR